MVIPVINNEVFLALKKIEVGAEPRLFILARKEDESVITKLVPLQSDGPCSVLPGISSTQLNSIYIELIEQGYIIEGIALRTRFSNRYWIAEYNKENGWHDHGNVFALGLPLFVMGYKEVSHWYSKEDVNKRQGYFIPYPPTIKD